MARVITRGGIEAYLRCKFKGYLKLAGEQGPRGDYELLLGELEDEVRSRAVDKLLARHSVAAADRGVLLTPARLRDGASLVLDATFGEDGLALTLDGLERVDGISQLGGFHYIPVLYFESERIRRTQRDLLGLYGLLRNPSTPSASVSVT